VAGEGRVNSSVAHRLKDGFVLTGHSTARLVVAAARRHDPRASGVVDRRPGAASRPIDRAAARGSSRVVGLMSRACAWAAVEDRGGRSREPIGIERTFPPGAGCVERGAGGRGRLAIAEPGPTWADGGAGQNGAGATAEPAQESGAGATGGAGQESEAGAGATGRSRSRAAAGTRAEPRPRPEGRPGRSRPGPLAWPGSGRGEEVVGSRAGSWTRGGAVRDGRATALLFDNRTLATEQVAFDPAADGSPHCW